MIKGAADFEELKKEIERVRPGMDVNQIIKIDLPFMESKEEFMVINIPSYGNGPQQNFSFISDKEVINYFSVSQLKMEKKLQKVLKRKHGESTISIFLLLKSVLKNYSQEFVRIREEMNRLDLDPILDEIEKSGRDLRKLTDRMEGLMQIMIELKEQGIECFKVELVNFDYDLLNAEARYWLERCRSHVYRIASLRTKSEMKSNKELNDTMKKLTVIMTFLSIAAIVVNVPGTVGAIFGIPALSDAYFEGHTHFLVITLVLTTVLSILLGYWYWKGLGLKRP